MKKPLQHRILDLILAEGPMSFGDLCDKLAPQHTNRKSITAALQAMRHENKVKSTRLYEGKAGAGIDMGTSAYGEQCAVGVLADAGVISANRVQRAESACAMIRLAWLPDGPYVLTDQTDHTDLPCMVSGIVRRATEEDIRTWQKQ